MLAAKRTGRSSAFTLVEILIVVIILGILAAIVIPEFNGATLSARQASLGQEVQMLKHQVQLYRVQHLDALPDLVTSWDPLVKPSDITGNVSSPAGQTYGPYLPSAPMNPLTNSNTVATSASPTVGWVYNAQTGEVHGVDASGNKTDDGITVLP